MTTDSGSEGNSTLGDIVNFLVQEGIITRNGKPFKEIKFHLSFPIHFVMAILDTKVKFTKEFMSQSLPRNFLIKCKRN
jgi:hypothetical protein